MKAVILAGGKGSRLRPITCNLPKPMTRLCGRPMLEYTLELLKKHGVTNAVMTLGYMPHLITEHFEDKHFCGIELAFSHEDSPLGTAGSVRKAADFNEDFIVISGDAMTDFDLTAAVEFHRKNNSDATLIVKKVADPREYGLVKMNENGKITGFIEKPDYSQSDSEFANTGIYILSERVLQMIPKNKKCDFASDIFPKMLKEGKRLYAFEADGYWCDIGDISTYLSCQTDMLTGKVNCNINCTNTPEYPTVTIIQPSYIGRDVTFGENCVIGPNCVIDDHSYIGNGAKIKNSVLLEGAAVSEGTHVSGAVICSGALMKRKSSAFELCVIGANTVIGENSQIKPNVRIWPEKHIDEGQIIKCNVKYGDCISRACDGEAVCGETLVDITPEFCARLGAAVASLKDAERICVGYSGAKAGKILKDAFVSGAASTGASVWDIGNSFGAVCSFAQNFTGIRYGVFIESGAYTFIRITDYSGLPTERKTERELSGIIRQGDFKKCVWSEVKDIEDAGGMLTLYCRELIALAPRGLEGFRVKIESEDKISGEVLSKIFSDLGCEEGADFIFKITESGKKLEIIHDEIHIDSCKALLLASMEEFENGKAVAVSDEMPTIFDETAQKLGGRFVRYIPSNADDSDHEARTIGKNMLFVRDGLMSAIKILDYLKKNDISLHDILVKLPTFSVVNDEIFIDRSPGEVVSALKMLPNSYEKGKIGVYFDFESGTGRVFSDKKGKKLRIMTEAVNMETAGEICGQIKSLIVNTLDRAPINR